jgi:hypothetical protein
LATPEGILAPNGVVAAVDVDDETVVARGEVDVGVSIKGVATGGVAIEHDSPVVEETPLMTFNGDVGNE